MDYLIYICLIIVIGAFFFVRNFSKGNNSMIITFILSIMGLVMLLNSPPEVITGSSTAITTDLMGQINGSTSQFTTEPLVIFSLDTTAFFALIFISFIFLSIFNIYFSK